jgi:hypothetical protein
VTERLDWKVWPKGLTDRLDRSIVLIHIVLIELTDQIDWSIWLIDLTDRFDWSIWLVDLTRRFDLTWLGLISLTNLFGDRLYWSIVLVDLTDRFDWSIWLVDLTDRFDWYYWTDRFDWVWSVWLICLVWSIVLIDCTGRFDWSILLTDQLDWSLGRHRSEYVLDWVLHFFQNWVNSSVGRALVQ